MSLLHNLYSIGEGSTEQIQIKLASSEHPVFKAHFPTNPILPGFLQIDIAQEIFNLDITKLKRVKFINIIKPNDTIFYKNHNNKITITNTENKKISEILYE